MAAPRIRLSRFVTAPHVTAPQRSASPALHSLSDFYRDEVLRCQRCLDTQRECYSAQAIHDVEEALTRVISSLDHICTSSDADAVIGRLLQQFDVATGLMSWSDPKQVH